MKENEEIKENKKEGKAKETEKGHREGKEGVPWDNRHQRSRKRNFRGAREPYRHT